MKKETALAFCYDYYNSHLLKDQNDDILYFKKEIFKYKPETILVIGAGTGRVAIPLSEICKIEVLDMDYYRLKRLNQKKKLKSYCMDFCKETPNKKYDMIIIPYSTIQSLFDYRMVEIFIKNSYKILNDEGILIFDVSESFNKKMNTKNLILFNDYSNEINSSIKCEFNCRRLKNKMKFRTNFMIEKYKYLVIEKETYLYYDEKLLKNIVKKYFELLKIDNGYGKNILLHKHIYHCSKGNI